MGAKKWVRRRLIGGGAAMVLAAVVFCTGQMQAQSLQRVTYVGGTALPGTGLHGTVSVSSPETLVFRGASELDIPYDHIVSYESNRRKVVHVGLLTEGVWRLLAPWPGARQLSISYRDADEHSQVVVLEMSRADEALLVEVLKTRVPQGALRQTRLVAHPSVLVRK